MKITPPIVLLAALFATTAPAGAQALVDPMRPATAAPGGEVTVARPSGPVLEQVILGEGRRFAVISGRKVALGDRVGDARIVAIGPDQVTLRGETTQVLRMFPRAERKSAGNAPAPQPRKAEQGS
jgi:MSHA biogenesis protein MshK